MDFTVINGEIVIELVNIAYVSTSSTFMVGDIQSVALRSAFESPPEKVIVGITLPFVS